MSENESDSVPGTRARRVVLLTGAAGGLGAVTTRVLLDDGFAVALVDVDAQRVRQVFDDLPSDLQHQAATFTCDLTDEAQVRDLVHTVCQRFGRVDVVVSNAGIEPPLDFESADMLVWDKTFQVNVRAPMLLIKHCLPGWKERGSGTVVCVGSRTWLSGSSTPAYVSSKAAVVGLVRAVTSHLGPLGINANVVAPSFMRTPLNELKWDSEYIDSYAQQFVEASPLRRLIEPVDVARTISFLASERARNISGEVLHVAAGSQLAPTVHATR